MKRIIAILQRNLKKVESDRTTLGKPLTDVVLQKSLMESKRPIILLLNMVTDIQDVDSID